MSVPVTGTGGETRGKVNRTEWQERWRKLDEATRQRVRDKAEFENMSLVGVIEQWPSLAPTFWTQPCRFEVAS